MSLLDRWDPLDSITSIWGSSEFDWFIFGADVFGSIFGPPEQAPRGSRGTYRPTPGPSLPAVIGEIPSDLEVLQREQRALEQQIADDPYYDFPGEPAVLDASILTGDPYDIGVVPQNDLEEEEMAHDWGHLIRQGASAVFGLGDNGAAAGNFVPNAFVPNQPNVISGGGAGGNGNGNDCDGMSWAGGAPPKGYKVVRDNCGNGVLRKVRRRRRRRMLTSGDKDDIASIVSMVGKGQMAAALINGSMRRG